MFKTEPAGSLYPAERGIEGMARGNFRTDDKVCLYCGHTSVVDGKSQPMPHKIGKGANKTYLCEKCYEKSTLKGE